MVFTISSFILARLLMRYLESRNEYDQLALETLSTPSPLPSDVDVFPESVSLSTTPLPPATTPPEIVPIQVDWANLRTINKQVIAWLYCEGTSINYPVTQTKNNTFYLSHNAKRKEDQAGSLFLDYRNNKGSELENLIIYGHRMKDGSMFGSLAKFSDVSYNDKHKEIYLLTPEQNYKIIVFSCRTVRSDPKYFPTSFATLEAEKSYWDKAISQSYWQKAPTAKPEGAIMITLSTCSKYDFRDNAHLMVHGWAVPLPD